MKWKHPVLEKDRLDLTDRPTLHPGWILPVAAPFLFTTAFWVFLGAVAAIAVISAVYARSRHRRNLGVSTEEENRLWRELAAAHKGKAAPQSRELVSRLTAYREHQEAAPAEDVAEDARNVADLFRTLRRDQAKEPTPVEAEVEEEQQARLSVEPTTGSATGLSYAAHQQDEPSISAPYLTPPPAPGRMTMNRPLHDVSTQWSSFPSPGPSATLQSWPGLMPRDEATAPVPGAWPDALEELPFQIRMDITDRLESDLEWAEPGKAPRAGWAPPLIERDRSAAEARRYERLRRQVDLTKELLRSGEPELRKEGVELAVKLEEDLHAIRSRRVKRAYRK